MLKLNYSNFSDGVPFFYAQNGWYDPWGSYFGFDGTIKRSDGQIWRLKKE